MQQHNPRLGPILTLLVVAAPFLAASAFAQLGKPLTFTVNQTVHSPGPVGCDYPAPVLNAFAFTVPSVATSQNATITTNLASQPGGLHFCLRFYPSPGAPGCPPEQLRVHGLCYPSSANEVTATGTSSFDFSRYMPDSGTSWKVALSAFGPAGDYTVSGSIRLAFPLSLVPVGVITVTNPGQGETILAGGQIMVMWTKRGTMADQVRIELVNNIEPQIVQVLIASAPNNGSAQCQAPANQQGYYRIRVITVDDKVKGESGQFRIMQAMPQR